MDLSIIVPVYNVEKYVRPCMESIFRQGLNESCFEVIIVNDGSTDKSMEVIDDIIQAHSNIIVINQENQGPAVARNNGLEAAHGKYILFMDSDDLLIDNRLTYLLDLAVQSQADLIVADFLKMSNDEITKFNTSSLQQNNRTVEELTGKELLARPLRQGFSCVWRTLHKKEFLDKNNIRFIPHIYFEDTPFTYQCQIKAGHSLRVNWQFIIYRIGNQSITSSFNKEKYMDYSTVIAKVWTITQQNALSAKLRQKTMDDIFNFFSLLLYYLSSDSHITHGEKLLILNNLKLLVPDLTFKKGFKQRFVSSLYHYTPSFYLSLRRFYALTLQDYLWEIKRLTLKQTDLYERIIHHSPSLQC